MTKQHDAQVEALAAALRYMDSDASIAAVAISILEQLTAAGYSIVPTAEIEQLRADYQAMLKEGREVIKREGKLIQQLAAQAQRVSELEAALNEMMPRYAEMFEAAGLGRASTDSVAMSIARKALLTGDAARQALTEGE